MDTVPHHPLLEVTLENLKNARKFYNMPDRNTVRECLENVKGWCAKQEHLQEANKHLPLDVLERIFMLARFSTEGTKIKIDRLFTSRALMPELFLKRTLKEFEPLWNCVNHCPLPKMTPDQSRILVTQFKTEKLDDFNLQSYFRYAFMIGEYRLFYDYCLSETVILDLKNVHLGLFSKLNPMVIRKSEFMCTEVFGTRIKGIHILNAPSFVDKVVILLKQSLREKVTSRLHVHSSYEDFYKFVPKEVLPADYGGDDKSLDKLSEQWIETLKSEEGQKKIDVFENLVADESKRRDSKFNEEYLGMPGSFRKLSVD